MKGLCSKLKQAALITGVMMVLCGIVYPLVVTGISHIAFPKEAKGSLIYREGQVVGSEIVGQEFTDPRLMKGRPSAVSYNTYTKEEKENGTYGGISSGSKNYGPSNPELIKRVEIDMEAFLKEYPYVKEEDVPTDLLTASGSGLDPHISPKAAALQIPYLVQATGLTKNQIREIVENNTEKKVLNIFGEENVNVLKVNIEIARLIHMIP